MSFYIVIICARSYSEFGCL